MNTAEQKQKWKFVESSRTISKPGATIVVKELILTDRGRQAITSGSTGIKQGAPERIGPEAPRSKDFAPA